jgi:raffinose/stachyose/melibiose transport system substrate-binding protein
MLRLPSISFFRAMLAALVVMFTFATMSSVPAQAQDSVTLRYVSWMSNGEDKPILEAFMAEYPNIQVEDQVLDGQTYDQLLKPQMISGDAPDVMLIMPYQYAPFVREGWLLDVTDEPGTEAMKALPALAASYTIDGKIYATMVNGLQSDQPFYYNVRYFEQLGVQPPTTIDELYALCDTIKAEGVDPMVFGGADIWPLEFIFTRGYYATHSRNQFGNSDPDLKLINGEVTIDDLYGDTFRFFESLVQRGCIGVASQSLTYDQSVQYFVDGRAAILPQGPWIAGLDVIKNANPDTFVLGAFAFPHEKVDGKIRIAGFPDRSIAISASTEHPEEARLLYNYFLETENLKNYLETQSLLTLVPGIDPAVDPALQDFVAAHNDTEQYEIFIGYEDAETVSIPPAWKAALDEVYPNILAGSTAEEELARLADVLEQVKPQVTISTK